MMSWVRVYSIRYTVMISDVIAHDSSEATAPTNAEANGEKDDRARGTRTSMNQCPGDVHPKSWCLWMFILKNDTIIYIKN